MLKQIFTVFKGITLYSVGNGFLITFWTVEGVGFWLFGIPTHTEGKFWRCILFQISVVSKFKGQCTWQIRVLFVTFRLAFETDFLHCSLSLSLFLSLCILENY